MTSYNEHADLDMYADQYADDRADRIAEINANLEDEPIKPIERPASNVGSWG